MNPSELLFPLVGSLFLPKGFQQHPERLPEHQGHHRARLVELHISLEEQVPGQGRVVVDASSEVDLPRDRRVGHPPRRPSPRSAGMGGGESVLPGPPPSSTTPMELDSPSFMGSHA
jgi:hypothetical protein